MVLKIVIFVGITIGIVLTIDMYDLQKKEKSYRKNNRVISGRTFVPLILRQSDLIKLESLGENHEQNGDIIRASTVMAVDWKVKVNSNNHSANTKISAIRAIIVKAVCDVTDIMYEESFEKKVRELVEYELNNMGLELLSFKILYSMANNMLYKINKDTDIKMEEKK